MRGSCQTCAHPDLEQINQALVAGGSFREVGKRYGLDKQALFRHKTSHIPAQLVAAQDARRIANGADMLDEMSKLHVRTLRILDEVEKAKDRKATLAAVREVRGNMELLAKLTMAMEQARREAGYGDGESDDELIDSIGTAIWGPNWCEDETKRQAKIAAGELIPCPTCRQAYIPRDAKLDTERLRLQLSGDDDTDGNW